MTYCPVAISGLNMMPLTVPRLQQHFFHDVLRQAGLLLATPFLSNRVIVAVAYSRGRWLR